MAESADNTKFHCPYCGGEMTRVEKGRRDNNGDLVWFVDVRYVCPFCSSMSPVIDSDDVSMQEYPGNEYDNAVLRKIANKKLDEAMANAEKSWR